MSNLSSMFGGNLRLTDSELNNWLYILDNISLADWVLDEDDFASNSSEKIPTQQSVKAYVDNSISELDGGTV